MSSGIKIILSGMEKPNSVRIPESNDIVPNAVARNNVMIFRNEVDVFMIRYMIIGFLTRSALFNNL